MANTSNIRGAQVVQSTIGGHRGRDTLCYVAAGDGTRLGIGDIVKLAVGSEPAGKYRTVTQAAATDLPCGVVTSIDPVLGVANGSNINLLLTYHPASTAGYVLVNMDPNVEFWLEEDGTAGNTLTTVACGENASPVVNLCSTVTGYSGTVLQSSSGAATSTLMLRILSLRDTMDNALGVSAKWLCMFNKHQYGSVGTTGNS